MCLYKNQKNQKPTDLLLAYFLHKNCGRFLSNRFCVPGHTRLPVHCVTQVATCCWSISSIGTFTKHTGPKIARSLDR